MLLCLSSRDWRSVFELAVEAAEGIAGRFADGPLSLDPSPVADLLDELMQAPEFGYAEVGERVPKWWAPWVGLLLISEMPHIAHWIRLPRGDWSRRR